jgi:hypothetical protein
MIIDMPLGTFVVLLLIGLAAGGCAIYERWKAAKDRRLK